MERFLNVNGQSDEDTVRRHNSTRTAYTFLCSFKWCCAVRVMDFAYDVPGVLTVFHVEIVPTSSSVDRMLWVIVGDLPSAYLVAHELPSVAQALDAYVDEMSGWIAAVRAGGPLGEVIPVDIEPTTKHADMLQRRLDFVKREIIPSLP